MRYNYIVEIRDILLPDLVLFVDRALLDLVRVLCVGCASTVDRPGGRTASAHAAQHCERIPSAILRARLLPASGSRGGGELAGREPLGRPSDARVCAWGGGGETSQSILSFSKSDPPQRNQLLPFRRFIHAHTYLLAGAMAIRRNARLRREYLYKKSLEGKEKEQFERKERLKQALQGASGRTGSLCDCFNVDAALFFRGQTNTCRPCKGCRKVAGRG